MSTLTPRLLQRAGLAAVALVTLAGAAATAQAATIRVNQSYVPADLAATAPAAAKHMTTIWGIRPRQDGRSATAVAAQPAAGSKAPGNPDATN